MVRTELWPFGNCTIVCSRYNCNDNCSGGGYTILAPSLGQLSSAKGEMFLILTFLLLATKTATSPQENSFASCRQHRWAVQNVILIAHCYFVFSFVFQFLKENVKGIFNGTIYHPPGPNIYTSYYSLSINVLPNFGFINLLLVRDSIFLLTFRVPE